MAYSQSNPPFLISQGIAGGLRLWVYKSIDAPAVVRTSGYFTNGWVLGMRKGDLVIVVDTDAAPITSQFMIVTEAVRGLVDLSDGLAVTPTDTD